MKAALLQTNPTVGALEANADQLLELTRQAASRGADLVVAPELSLVGYPPRDLLDRPVFLRRVGQLTQRLIDESPNGVTLIFGTVGGTRDGSPCILDTASARPGLLGNDALAARGGKLLHHARKQLLPTYDVFDEARYFVPGRGVTRLEVAGVKVGITICEDAWGADDNDINQRYSADPIAEAAGVELLLNLSASPFTLPKHNAREQVFRRVATRLGAPVLLVNQVGGNDELIFDGRSTVYGPGGEVLTRAATFAEDLKLWELGTPSPPAAEHASPPEELAYRALVLGLHDYARKCGFQRAVLGLSGGIDSALTATIAADALGPENVTGVAMPTRYSSQGSIQDARELADNLGIGFHLVDIDPIFQTYLDHLEPALDAVQAPGAKDTTLENIQARIRGATVMAFSNRSGALVLTTGNKSEVAVGYCTLYGDMVGGLAVISDVPKTMVYRVSRWINRDSVRIPVSSIEKPPSAELAPDQLDQDSLPPYDILDRILELFVEQGAGRDAIVADGSPAEAVDHVLRLLRINEYKRRQAAPGLIITRKAFGVGRRMPIAQGFRE